uniref:Protein kinase n=1 Tax=Echinococcus granulosus TaxID=6210 RepID=A0A068WPW3_ECHGR|nr:protein kinase [Echinococcus granulosus]
MTCPTAQRTFMKDLQQLYRTIEASTDGQAFIVGIDEMSVKVSLRPKSGYNAHAEFMLTIKCHSAYPNIRPDVSFDSPIFHPNVDPSTGSVCVSLLNEWQSCYSLVDLVKALLCLIDHPMFDSPVHPLGEVNSPAQLARKTARLLAGLPVDGLYFPPNPVWVEWARVNGCLPTEGEEEEEFEGVEEGVGLNDEFDQKGDGGVGASANTAASEDEDSTIGAFCAPFDTTSDAVPSFAKIRYSFNPEGENNSYNPCERLWSPFEVESQRVLIWHPSNSTGTDTYTVFYFVEFLGTEHHRTDLGQHYNTLFIGSALREHQSHPESRQTSSSCPWYALSWYPEASYHSYTSYDSSLNLSNMFEVKKKVMRDLTADFCPWSALDGKGINGLFDGLFFESNQNRETFTCLLDGDGDGDSESQDIGRPFESCSSDRKEVFWEIAELSEMEDSGGAAHHADGLSAESEVSLTGEEDDYANELDNERKKLPSPPPPSFLSSATYEHFRATCAQIIGCLYCLEDYICIKSAINAHLGPLCKWVFRQTRWPIRFAPQQNVDLSMTGIQIPPWRASSARMMLDICHFCAKNQDMSNFVLLDPMALSPLSPLLNLMQHHALPRPRLTGVLWMTPLDALSPFYHVPIPLREERKDSEDDGCEEGDGVYPTPTCLRFLTITAFLTNWVAWLSRMEGYAALGMSRFHPMLISAPVAACLLQPFSLGCGQTPLLDLWPMWVLRRLLTLSLKLPQLQIPFLHHSRQRLQCLFPFSDLDEI